MKAEDICKVENAGKRYTHPDGTRAGIDDAGTLFWDTRGAPPVVMRPGRFDGWETVKPVPKPATDEQIAAARCPKCGAGVMRIGGEGLSDPRVYCKCASDSSIIRACHWNGPLSECITAPVIIAQNCTIRGETLQERMAKARCPVCGERVRHIPAHSCDYVECQGSGSCLWRGYLDACVIAPTMPTPHVEEWEVKGNYVCPGKGFQGSRYCLHIGGESWVSENKKLIARYLGYYIIKLPNGDRIKSYHSAVIYDTKTQGWRDPLCHPRINRRRDVLVCASAVPMWIEEGK